MLWHLHLQLCAGFTYEKESQIEAKWVLKVGSHESVRALLSRDCGVVEPYLDRRRVRIAFGGKCGVVGHGFRWIEDANFIG